MFNAVLNIFKMFSIFRCLFFYFFNRNLIIPNDGNILKCIKKTHKDFLENTPSIGKPVEEIHFFLLAIRLIHWVTRWCHQEIVLWNHLIHRTSDTSVKTLPNWLLLIIVSLTKLSENNGIDFELRKKEH